MLAYKQLSLQIASNRVFVGLLFLLTILPGFSFFFVRFSIDGNVLRLNEILEKGGDAERYQTALSANTVLARNFFAALLVLVVVVFIIFFYRFYSESHKTLGCLKALGFQDAYLCRCFTAFTALMSMVGGGMGLVCAYFLSDILILANQETYGVKGLTKALSGSTVLVGILCPVALFSMTAWLCYGFIRGKEPGSLILENRNTAHMAPILKIANRITEAIPIKNKFPLRLALQKPVALCLMIVAVLSFTVCIILAYSLNISSGKVYNSLTQGHNYRYFTKYEDLMEPKEQEELELTMLNYDAGISYKGQMIEQTMAGIYTNNELYELREKNGGLLSVPDLSTVVIGLGLQEVYGISVGDLLEITVLGQTKELTVSHVAENAQSQTIYVNGEALAAWADVPVGSYHTLFSNVLPKDNRGKTISSEQREALLKQDAVSNKVSGVINQGIGVVVGGILLLLALYMNFLDNTRDILILHTLGYENRTIRKMLMDVYRPLLLLFFCVTLLPGIAIVKSIQRGLSVSTGDYMPFGTNVWVVALAVVGLLAMYQLVQLVFNAAVARAIRNENISEYTN